MKKTPAFLSKIKLNFSLTVFLFGTSALSRIDAQTSECATFSTPAEDVFYQQLALESTTQGGSANRENIYLAMRTVVFTNNLGQSNVTAIQVKKAIETAQTIYAKLGIVLNSCDPIFIKNNALYSFEKSTEIPLLENLVTENVINVFVTNELTSNDQDVCGFAIFPFTEGKKYVVLNAECVSNNSTFSHELGHFFGLYHTHTTTFGKEYVSRINCSNAGDLLCDTPADPLLGSSNVSSDCLYYGSKVDAFGEFYYPDVRNLMSYSLKSCRDRFTLEQISIMQSVAKKYSVLYSKGCYGNDIGLHSIYEFTQSPLAGEGFSLPFEIKLHTISTDFDYSLNATLVDPSGKSIYLATNQYSSTLESFEDNISIDLPAKLYSGNYVLKLALELPAGILEINASDNEVSFPFSIDYAKLGNRNVFYTSASRNVHLFVENVALGKVAVQVFDVSGKLLKQVQDFQSKSGEYVNSIDVSFLLAGLYLVRIEAGKESYTGKIVVD
jgi:hypothetical protein